MDLSNLIKLYQERLAAIPRLACEELSTQVINRTPVDTGQARQRWSPDVNGESLGNSSDQLDSQIKRLNAGDKFTLLNNLKYIRTLEYGSSAQAPSGMVRISVKGWPQIVESAIRASRNK